MRQIAIFFIDGIINTASEKIHPRNWEVDDGDFEVDSDSWNFHGFALLRMRMVVFLKLARSILATWWVLQVQNVCWRKFRIKSIPS